MFYGRDHCWVPQIWHESKFQKNPFHHKMIQFRYVLIFEMIMYVWPFQFSTSCFNLLMAFKSCEILTLAFFTKFDKVINNSVVEIFIFQECTTCFCKYYYNTIINAQKRNIKSTTIKIIDKDLNLLITFLIKCIKNNIQLQPL
jgi:hypothetical protein